MQSAPLPPNESARLAALRSCDVLDTAPDALFDDLAGLASRLCGTPIALVSLVDADRQWFKSRVGLSATETPRSLAFCAHAILEPDRTFVVPDARLDERFADNPLVQDAPNVTFYAGVPLVEAGGHALGTLCVIDTEARSLTADQLESLRILGRQVVTLLEARRRCQELEQARRIAQTALEARTTFLANMSHEIRTPLGAILGFADLLRDETSLTPGARELVETVARNGKHLSSLVGDVLDLSKIEADGIHIEDTPVELRTLVGEVVELQRFASNAKEIGLEAHCDASVPSVLSCDATRLRQILLNLTGNAIKFTETGSVSVRLRTERDKEGNRSIAFEISDTGTGIPPERLDAIFDAFGQADGSTARRFGGTGLGLTISRRLAEAMGGTLAARSALGDGSVFTLLLPVRVAKSSPRRLGSGAGEQNEAPLNGACVLVVDDMPDNRLLVRRILESAGADVRCAEGGIRGLEILQERGSVVDVVLMDLSMPELDGFETLARLRERGDERSVVALTAAVLPQDRESCSAAGFEGYLTKPIDRAALVAMVTRLVRDGRRSAA